MDLVQEDWAIGAEVGIRIRKGRAEEVGIHDMEVVDDGSLNSFKAGIHKRWRSNNLDVDVFDGSLLEQDADCGFAYERVARDSIDNVAACGMRTEHSLNDGIVGFFEGAAGFIFIIERDDICRASGCEMFSEGSCFGAGMPLGAEENGKVAG
jgi:hypothetical protein